MCTLFIGKTVNLHCANVKNVSVKSFQFMNKKLQLLEISPFTCMIEEYAANGDLLQRIKRYGGIEEDESRFYFRQLIEALSYLQSVEVVHRDLKCENVFLDTCDNIKLGDFGFSRYMRAGDESKTFCGSRAYTAPEVLRSRPYSGNTVDIWSAGVVLYVMVTGLMPYDDRHPKKMLIKQLQHRLLHSTCSFLFIQVESIP
ncbi:unnamed protein product [Anisakis simplex]|uniref:Testis-specific serine/threonine-protein kinase 3 (inferred by orthology to a human protein) n=1 Tax=Anisakis simplex TaxID=6269 RepID=A0A0M3JDP3_ANISI|nr:unnamed protein product [Anisakis simplex]